MRKTTIKKETRDMKFKCPYDERPGKKFSDNCYAFGCIHQINGDPEIAYLLINERKKHKRN